MELNSNSPEGKDLIFIEVLKKCIINILNFERELVKKGNKIKILSLENKMTSMIRVNQNSDVILTGTIDRIDTFNNNLRIIDYKSGKIETNYLKFKGFEILKNNHKYSNMLQLLFYKLLVSKKHQDVNDIGLCYFKKNNNPYEFIENSEDIEISKIENFIREIIESIMEKESFIDSGNPA